jgi:prepilin-type N-terminal cleavage/methylation domain-containing protein
MIADRHRSGGRTGFTLIELLIVIGIMLMLSTLAITGISRTLRAAAINNAVAAVRNVCSLAQSQAYTQVMAADVAYPGVLIAKRNGRWTAAAITATASNSVGVDFDDAMLDAEGSPAITQFAPNVIVWTGDGPASPTERLVWFFEPGTGRVVLPGTVNGFTAPGAMVGTAPPPLFDNGGANLVFGARTESLQIVAAPTATNPGLSFRSRDQRTKRSIAVQPTGAVDVREF